MGQFEGVEMERMLMMGLSCVHPDKKEIVNLGGDRPSLDDALYMTQPNLAKTCSGKATHINITSNGFQYGVFVAVGIRPREIVERKGEKQAGSCETKEREARSSERDRPTLFTGKEERGKAGNIGSVNGKEQRERI
ncbi:hypothetical protein SDJN03_07037, partial [Cucurbita argyrosperma subsp. sororia]